MGVRKNPCACDKHSGNSLTESASLQSPVADKKVGGNPITDSLRRRCSSWFVALIILLIPLGILLRANLVRQGDGWPARAGWTAAPAEIEIATLVLREGLECVLVLAAITAGLQRARRAYHRSIAVGVALGVAATLLTWRIAARLLDDLGRRSSALAVQAGTGLLAIVVLLVVMNWFFHKLYWTGWISLHQPKKAGSAARGGGWRARLGCLPGNGVAGFYLLLSRGL